MTSRFELLPAIDIAMGKSVRLTHGEEVASGKFVDPITIATEFEQSGADWIHLVDLDQAFRRGNNSAQLAQIVANFPSLRFQLSGGIADQETFDLAKSAGASRINISGLALENPNWLEAIFNTEDSLTFGLDISDGEVVPRGSNQSFGTLAKVVDYLDSLGCGQYIVTDVKRDGMLLGPNIDILKTVFDLTGKPVIASGGISSLADLAELLDLGNFQVSGAILGKALYVGNFSLIEAIKLVAELD